MAVAPTRSDAVLVRRLQAGFSGIRLGSRQGGLQHRLLLCRRIADERDGFVRRAARSNQVFGDLADMFHRHVHDDDRRSGRNALPVDAVGDHAR